MGGMSGLRRISVLLVEDDADCAEVFGEALRAAGHEVRITASPAQVRRAIGERVPDVVLLDGQLEGGDGIELARELRAGGLPTTPIVLTTGRTLVEVSARARRAGITAVLVKPVELAVLLAEIQRLVPAPELRATT